MQRLLFSLWIVGVIFTGASCRGDVSEQPPIHLIPNMDTQEKAKAYSKDTSGLFANGRSMRMPVEGTIARGTLEEDQVWLTGMGADGQPSAKFPERFTSNDETHATGRIQFRIYCSPCHGRDGDGKGTVAARGGLKVPPPSFHDARMKEMPLGKFFAAMTLGVNDGNMPSYAAQIPVENRWAIASWIRELQRQRDPNVSDVFVSNAPKVDMSKASALMGEQVYKQQGCNACHSVDGSKMLGPTYKGLFGKMESTDKGDMKADEAYLKRSIKEPTAETVTGFPAGVMPKKPVTDIEVDALVMYIKSLK